jgi:hypothetical protein
VLHPMPTSVKVGPHIYAIVRQAASGGNGWCDFNALQIIVKPRLRRGKAREILLHEILHACTYPSLNGCGRYTDEEFVTGISPALLQVIVENPKLLAYLAGSI